MKIFKGDPLIKFVPEGHKYYLQGKGHAKTHSVSAVRSDFMEPFDPAIAYYVARKLLRGPKWRTGMINPSEAKIKKKEKEVLAMWKDRADRSNVHGDIIHKGMQQGTETGVAPDNMRLVYEKFRTLFFMYPLTYCEVLMALHSKMICGQCDYMSYRRKSSNVVDLADIKTNLFKGITFDTIKRDDGKLKHYDRFMHGPVGHMEQSGYNDYANQLSIYAYILVKQYGLRIGNMRIIYIDINEEDLQSGELITNFGITTYPVPFMYHEAEKMVEQYYAEKIDNDF